MAKAKEKAATEGTAADPTTAAAPQGTETVATAAKPKKGPPIRLVEEAGKPLMLVQARSDAGAIRTAMEGRLSARIVTGRELADLASTMSVVDEAPRK